jgi:replicative DNA helicase
MSEQTENTLTAYKGPEFQQKLMWQLLVEPEYAEKTIPILAVEYFDDPNIKRLFLIMLEYVKAYGKAPNLQNQSIVQAINEFKTPGNQIEEELLFAVIERIKLWNERILNQSLMHDGEAVQKSTNEFIKQQEIRKLGETILIKVKNGDIKSKFFLQEFEEKVQKIATIGIEEDCGSDVIEGLEFALTKEFRKTIPTGVTVIDDLTGGGLGKGEIGLILTPSGVGKTTLLTKIANTARENNYNVLQVIFEDTKPQIQRKHVTIWTKIPLSQLDEQHELALQKSQYHINNELGPGRLTIKKFSQEDTTMRDVKDYILREQKKWGFKFDILVLDYLDCLESHKRTMDRNEAELVIVKSFEALASDLDIPCWSAIQSNRSGFDAELVEAHQSGGNIKRLQKAHFFMSVAKTPDQKEASLANIRIIKARFAQDGQTFKDCIFNNDTMQIIIKDDRYVGGAAYQNRKKLTDEVIEENARKIEEHGRGIGMHTIISTAMPEVPENPLERDMRKKFMEQNNIVDPPYTVILPEPETNISVIKPEYTVKDKNEDTFELEDKPIENAEWNKQNSGENTEWNKQNVINDGVNEGATEGVNDGVNKNVEPILELDGSIEAVKHEEIKTEITPTVKKIYTETEKFNLIEAEKKLNRDPDEVSPAQKHLHDYLVKLRVNDCVNKKE